MAVIAAVPGASPASLAMLRGDETFPFSQTRGAALRRTASRLATTREPRVAAPKGAALCRGLRRGGRHVCRAESADDLPSPETQRHLEAVGASLSAFRAGSAAWAAAPPPPALLTALEAAALLDARQAGSAACEVSLDIGRSVTAAEITAGGASVAAGGAKVLVPWEAIKDISDDRNGCFRVLADGSLEKVQLFSNTTGRPVSLMPSGWRVPPTALIAGFSMHRFGKGTAVSPIRNGCRLLDICTGLGYTAVGAAEQGAVVTTVELDDAMQDMCAANPWSRSANPITQVIGDAMDVVASLPDRQFDRIVHDPPTFALGGGLFSTVFYEQLCRILAARGVLYHYTGDPESKGTARVVKGVVKRLQEAGFEHVLVDSYGHGVIASHMPVRPNRPKRDAPGRRSGRAEAPLGYGAEGRGNWGAAGGGGGGGAGGGGSGGAPPPPRRRAPAKKNGGEARRGAVRLVDIDLDDC